MLGIIDKCAAVMQNIITEQTHTGLQLSLKNIG